MPVPSKNIGREGKIVKIVIKEKYLLGRENEVLPETKYIDFSMHLINIFHESLFFVYTTTTMSNEANHGNMFYAKIPTKPTLGETVNFLF